jgi:hypothetical protein
MSFKDFYISEVKNDINLIEQIKKYLYESDGDESWKEFVDHQEIGNCQTIVADIIRKFPQVKKYFGEIEVDEPYVDEDGNEQILMTHHWVKINGIPYDFSKGTLKEHIKFDDIYDPEISPNEIERYN